MALNRITRTGAARRASLLLVAALVAIAALAGCGGGDSPAAVPDQAADAETLNNILARELAVVRAYERTFPLLHGAALASAREFRAAEQEHTNAIVRALRGLGEEAEPEEEEVQSEGLETQADALGFLYEVENVSIAYDLQAIARLTSPAPRSLLGSIAANQAQHLVVLRRALGANAAESIPGAFEDGGTPAPSEMIDE